MDDSFEGVELSEELNPIIVPIGLYRFFLAHGKEGREAKDVWEHLVYTARMQQTNQVWAANAYLRDGLELGERKVKSLLAFLKEHGLIEYIEPERDENGRFVAGAKRYIRVKASSQYLQSSERAFTARAATAHVGYDKQMLEGRNGEMLEGGSEAAPAGSENAPPENHHEQEPPQSTKQHNSAPTSPTSEEGSEGEHHSLEMRDGTIITGDKRAFDFLRATWDWPTVMRYVEKVWLHYPKDTNLDVFRKAWQWLEQDNVPRKPKGESTGKWWLTAELTEHEQRERETFADLQRKCEEAAGVSNMLQLDRWCQKNGVDLDWNDLATTLARIQEAAEPELVEVF